MKLRKLSLAVAVLILIMLLAACTTESGPEPTTVPEATLPPASNSATTYTGQIINSGQLINEAGGYSLTIPDAWFNKVSYEMDGTHTYIYHITKYQDELEINPVLLHIDASSEVDENTSGANIFLTLDNVNYYEVLRFDAPYNQDSKDDIEYFALYEQAPQVLESVREVNSAGTPRGDVVTEDTIVNGAGGYEIPIPVSWFNQTSYETDGGETVIYHITENPNEIEQNPELLRICLSDCLDDTTGLNVFLELDGISYYQVERFDFPYQDNTSADGAEFAGFTNDIPMILQSFWVLDESLINEEINMIDVSCFTQADALFAGFYMNDATIDEVLSGISEEYSDYESVVFEATGETLESFEFSFGTLSFTDGLFSYADIIGGNYRGPRGVLVGDNIADIMSNYSFDIEEITPDAEIVYRGNAGSDSIEFVPPYGVRYVNSDGSSNLYYCCFSDDEDLSGITTEDLEMNHMFMPSYNVMFCFDSNDQLMNYSVFYTNGAE